MEVYKMSEDGEKILKFVKEIRKLCHNMSLLLMTVDEQMGSKDWEKAGNTAIADSSASVDIPERWFPENIFRFYINTKYPNILVFVSILLDDIESKIIKPLIELIPKLEKS
jgi:hypothetical protein